MKVIIDIDNDNVIGLLAMMGATKEVSEPIKKRLAENEEVELNLEVAGSEAAELRLGLTALCIAQIGNDLKLDV